MADTIKQRLMTPGPTQVPPGVLQEMSQPVIHHRTSQFQAIFKEVSNRLQSIFRTQNPVLTITGSGTTAFEACQISLIKPATKALTIANGKFGERWQDIYDAYGVKQIKINPPWGHVVNPNQITEILKANPDISVITVVHSETSTATACDMKSIAAASRASGNDVLLIVDGITAVGALPVEMDTLEIDVLVTGSQKAMMLPPGLGFVGLSKRAIERLNHVTPSGCYNLDLRRWLATWYQVDVPFTPAVNLIRGQRVALEMIETQGLENVWRRTAAFAASVRAAFEAMNLQLISTSPSDSVTGAFYPDGIDDSTFRSRLRDRHGIHIAGGQSGRGANWKGKIFRVSHMGYVDAEDTLTTLSAIETELINAGQAIPSGTAISAAEPHLGATI